MHYDSPAPRSPWLVTSGEPDPAAVERLLRLLPQWFGIEASIIEYVESARELPTYLAWPGARPTGGKDRRQPLGVLLAASSRWRRSMICGPRTRA